MELWQQVPQWIISGITVGTIYGLVALGFVVIYSVTRVINIAQGEFVMLGAMLTITLANSLPLVPALMLAVLATAVIGAVIERVALHPARRAATVILIMITVGIDIVLRGLALIVWGTQPYALRPFTAGPPILLGTGVITRQALWVIGIALVALLVCFGFFRFTLLGMALRACAANPLAARLVGIKPEWMALLAWAGSAGLAALGGAVIAPITFGTSAMGLDLGLRGFVAAVMGGLESPVGAVWGGLVLGILESVGAGLSSGLKDVIAFFVLLVVLILREVNVMRLARQLMLRPQARMSGGR